MFKRALDIAVSLGTIAAAAAIVWAVFADSGNARRWPWLPREATRQTGYLRGEKINSLPGVDFRASDRTVVVVFGSRCHFCVEGAPYYQRLVSFRDKRHAKVRIVAVGSEQDPGAAQFPGQQGWRPDQIVRVASSSLRVRGTPTILLVDSNGAVVASWLGRTDPDTIKEIVRTTFE